MTSPKKPLTTLARKALAESGQDEVTVDATLPTECFYTLDHVPSRLRGQTTTARITFLRPERK